MTPEQARAAAEAVVDRRAYARDPELRAAAIAAVTAELLAANQ